MFPYSLGRSRQTSTAIQNGVTERPIFIRD